MGRVNKAIRNPGLRMSTHAEAVSRESLLRWRGIGPMYLWMLVGNRFPGMKTIVVKIGGSTLTRDGVADEGYLGGVARQVAILRDEGTRVVIVTSGAIRVGLGLIGRGDAVRLAEKQAAAAIGQSLVMRAYRRAFAAHEMHVAQLLLTRSDIAERRSFLNARHTMTQLFKWNVVPIVNENDTVATEEIRFGDNDTLAALSALVAEAETVILLSDVDGFYLPGEAMPLSRVERISGEIEAAAGGAGTRGGTGGMKTKIEAARIATEAGIDLCIASGRAADVVLRLARDEALGTRFVGRRTSKGGSMSGRKRWIAYGRAPQGVLTLHERARAALQGGASLLPVGVVDVEGDFDVNALVSLRDENGEIGRGLCRFSAADLKRIAGLHSSQIASVLGRAAGEEAIRRDDLILRQHGQSTP